MRQVLVLAVMKLPMTNRKLTDEEKRLWRIYTRDIKAIARDNIPSDEKKPTLTYDIKVPQKPNFRRHASPKLSNHESLKEKDANWGKKLKQGKVKIEGKIDLHGMTCVQAHQKLYDFLSRAQMNGKRAILVVTGKGGPKRDLGQYRFSEFENSHGILKREVPMWLSGGSMRHMIVSFQEARARDGGAGALYVVLKRKS